MQRSHLLTQEGENSDNLVRKCACGREIGPERRKDTKICSTCSREQAKARFEEKLKAAGITRTDYNRKCKEKIRNADPEGYKRKQKKWKQDSRDARRRMQEAKAQRGTHHDGAVGPAHAQGSGGAPALL